MNNSTSSDASSQPRFRDRLSDVDRKVLFAIVATSAEKVGGGDIADICREAAHELASRRDQARGQDDERGAVRWTALLNEIAEDTTGFRTYAESVSHWALMSPAEKKAATEPTEPQMRLLDKLGYRGIVRDRREASAIITRLQNRR